MEKQYYSRGVRNSNTVGLSVSGRKFKGWFIPALLAVGAAGAASAEIAGLGLTMVALPFILFMTMFTGTVDGEGALSSILVYAIFTPLMTGIALRQDVAVVVVTTVCVGLVPLLCIPYKPFLWKNSAASTPILIFTLFLNMSVTNAVYTVTLVLTIILKSLVTWLLCITVVHLTRTLLHNRRFLQWVLKQE